MKRQIPTSEEWIADWLEGSPKPSETKIWNTALPCPSVPNQCLNYQVFSLNFYYCATKAEIAISAIWAEEMGGV